MTRQGSLEHRAAHEFRIAPVRATCLAVARRWAILVSAVVAAACGSHTSSIDFGADGGSGGSGSGAATSGNAFGSGASSGSGGFASPSGDDAGSNVAPVMPTTTPFVLDDTGNSGLPAATIGELKMGGSSCTTTVLYPYPDTMFPAEGLPPVIQWTGAADAAYVKMTYGDPKFVSYEAAVGATNPGRFNIPQTGWNAVSIRTPTPPAPRAPLQITLTVKSGTALSTCKLQWYVAAGALDGALYYNSYDDPTASAELGRTSGNQGSVLRLAFGATAPEVFLLYTGPITPAALSGPCYGCHSVSAKGSSLAATLHNYGGAYRAGAGAQKEFLVFTYNVQQNPKPNPPSLYTTGIPSATFGGMTPDGKYLLTIGNPDCTAGSDTYPRTPNNFTLVEGASVAKLWDVQTGQPATAAGLTADNYMWMPQFSPNGDKVVFNYAKPDGKGRTDRRQLATMDYDASTRTFSNLQVLYRDDGPAPSLPYTGWSMPTGDGAIATGNGGCTQNMQATPGKTYDDTCAGPCYPGWPFFTPDGKKVIFVRGTEPDFVSTAPGLGRNGPSPSTLYVVDVATKVARPLAAANAGASSMNLGYEYFPTVMPVAKGGQFWMFFTSRRTYGNTPYAGLGLPDSKKIWAAAVDIGAPDNVDPSHPPFYLLGQGASGNIRAFPTLNPCMSDGQSCATGLDCCGGTCVGEGRAATCGSPVMGMCAKLEDKCTTDSDCCDKSQECLGGFCALPPPK